jgi:hypothetical protein
MAPIISPSLDQEALDIIGELIYEENGRLQINYEGTLAYISDDAPDTYGLTLGSSSSLFSPDELGVAGLAFGIQIALDQCLPFSCLWYNGGDSPLDMLTLKEFEEKLNANL